MTATTDRRERVLQVDEHKTLWRDLDTGIAWVEDGSTGAGHSCHPNICDSGSVEGMKRQGFWRKNDRTVRSHGFIYNIDSCFRSDELDELARQHCQCGGQH